MFSALSRIAAFVAICNVPAPVLNESKPTPSKNITIEELLAPAPERTIAHKAPVPGEHYIPTLELDDEVSSDTTDPLIKEIALDNQDGAEYIILRINSPGGEVFSGMELSKAIEDSHAPVICVVDMMAASMAGYILESCAERVMTKRSLIMMHAVAGGASGQPAHIEDFLKMLNALNDSMIEHLCHRTVLTFEELKERISHDQSWWIGWRDAKNLEIVDHVVESYQGVVKLYKGGGHLS